MKQTSADRRVMSILGIENMRDKLCKSNELLDLIQKVRLRKLLRFTSLTVQIITLVTK